MSLTPEFTIPGRSAAVSGGEFCTVRTSHLLFLPERYVKVLEENLGLESTGRYWDSIRSIDCSQRSLLENITITLAVEKFVVSAWEYTTETDIEIENKGKERRCECICTE